MKDSPAMPMTTVFYIRDITTHFYKLPDVARFSKIAQTKLRQLIKLIAKLI